MVLTNMSIYSYDVGIDGIFYNLSESEAEVTYEELSGSSPYALYSLYTGTIVIPDSITYLGKIYNVTKIGMRAFYRCGGLNSVTVPNSVTTIGEYNQEIMGKTNVEIIPVIA